MMRLAVRRCRPRRQGRGQAGSTDRPCRWSTARSSRRAPRCSPTMALARAAPAASIRSLFDRMIRSAQATWSSNTSSTGSSWSSESSALRCAASASMSEATRPSASAAPSTTAMTPSTVTRLLTRRPLERLHQRLRQSQARGLDQDVVDLRRARQDQVERRHEIVGHGAADAAIGELDDVLLRAGLDAAAFEDLAVDADIAELVDDDRQPAAAGVLQDVADQRRLAGAEKAGDDGAGDAFERCGHDWIPMMARGGMRATRPRFRLSGRPRQGSRPSTRSGEQAGAGDEVGAAVGARGRRTHSSRRRASAARPTAGACNCRGIRPRRPGWRARAAASRVAAASSAAGTRLGIGAGRIAAGAAHQNRDVAAINGIRREPAASPAAFMSRRDALEFQSQAPRPGHPPGFEEDILRRQVSWLAGRRLRAAFPGRQCPVAIGRRLVAHSCGDSRGFGASPAPHSLLAPPVAERDRRAGI